MSDKKDLAIKLGQTIYSNTIESLQSQLQTKDALIKELTRCEIFINSEGDCFKYKEPEGYCHGCKNKQQLENMERE